MDLGGHSREEIEDMTGAIPLLLDGSIVEGKIDLSPGALLDVGVRVREASNAIRIERPMMWDEYDSFRFLDKDITDFCPSHCANMNACILGLAVPNRKSLPACDDHRYFFCEETGPVGQRSWVSRYACGAARDTMANILTLHKMHTRNIDNYVRAIRIIDHSVASIGSIAEKGVLVSIEQQGIPTISNLNHRMHRVVFSTDFPIFNDNHPMVLYTPYATNYPAIDAVVLRIDKETKTCALYPIQITVTTKHSDSEALFVMGALHGQALAVY